MDAGQRRLLAREMSLASANISDYLCHHLLLILFYGTAQFVKGAGAIIYDG